QTCIRASTYTEWPIFVLIEMGITFVFTLEYLLRLLVWPNPARYALSFWGLIDLATVLPLYVLWLWPELGMNYLFIWRTLRAVRVLRILKLLRIMSSSSLLW
ncbi:ion transporter, partial [Leptospira borgpetersenii serovar Hardjo-bovis]|nr:ion transporter [Leptospira borgpetersenii serovar Hardjo-bovis]